MRTQLRRLVRDPFVIILAVVAVLCLALFVGNSIGQSREESTPDPISQTELVAQYQDIAPDAQATAGDIVNLATIACERLGSGVSLGQLVSSTAETYGDGRRAKQVLRVLVSYGCPGHLDDF